jgi:hypothetical protein
MKNISTGTGLAIVAAAALAYPFVSSLAPNASASSAVTAAVAAVNTAATAQTGPTIVWYQSFARNQAVGISGNGNAIQRRSDGFWVLRAWSDGKIEGRWVSVGDPSITGDTTPLSSCYGLNLPAPCIGPWVVINDPAHGLTYRSDINFDSKVDGADLSQVLNDWGDAPRQDIPPSTCPLNLINP